MCWARQNVPLAAACHGIKIAPRSQTVVNLTFDVVANGKGEFRQLKSAGKNIQRDLPEKIFRNNQEQWWNLSTRRKTWVYTSAGFPELPWNSWSNDVYPLLVAMITDDWQFTYQSNLRAFISPGKTLKIIFWFTEQNRKKYFQFLLHNSQSTIMMTNHSALAKKMYNYSDRDRE